MSKISNNSFGHWVVKHRKISALVSLTLAMALILTVSFKGFKLGIDFAGGSIIDFSIPQDSEVNNFEQLEILIKESSGISAFTLQSQGEGRWVCSFGQSQEFSPTVFQENLKKLIDGINFLQVESVGPQISSSLMNQAFKSIAFAFVSIVLYLAIRFNWHLALSGIMVLILDLIGVIGFVSIFQIEINLTIMSAFLSIIGYCINDTVVLYDRIRSNILKIQTKIDQAVQVSLDQVLRRSILTSVVTMLSLLGMVGFTDGDIRYFAITVCFGIVFGTIGSVIISSVLPIFFKMEASDLISKAAEEKPADFYSR